MPTKKSSGKGKKTKRGSTEHPALEPSLNLRSRFELIEIDYKEKLSKKNKDWLNKFNEEYVNASLDSKNLSRNLHNTDKLKKDCYNRNNARNRDILNRGKASGTLNYLEDLNREDRLTLSPEDILLLEEMEKLSESGDDTDNNS